MFPLDRERDAGFRSIVDRVDRYREQSGRSGPRVGLALSSGAARGLAHIGVLKVLSEAGVEYDLVAGSSIGAVIGAMVACGTPVQEIEKVASRISRIRMLAYTDLTLPVKGLLGGQRIQSLLNTFFEGKRFEDTAVPFVVAATDILTGEEMVIDSGAIIDGVRASMSIPGVFVPHIVSGRHLVDGGLVNPVPVDYLRLAGMDICISVNVVPRVDRKYIEEPSAVDILLNAFDIMEHRVTLSKGQEADVEIRPAVDQVSGIEFWRAVELMKSGEEAALAHVARIRELIDR